MKTLSKSKSHILSIKNSETFSNYSTSQSQRKHNNGNQSTAIYNIITNEPFIGSKNNSFNSNLNKSLNTNKNTTFYKTYNNPILQTNKSSSNTLLQTICKKEKNVFDNKSIKDIEALNKTSTSTNYKASFLSSNYKSNKNYSSIFRNKVESNNFSKRMQGTLNLFKSENSTKFNSADSDNNDIYGYKYKNEPVKLRVQVSTSNDSVKTNKSLNIHNKTNFNINGIYNDDFNVKPTKK